MSASRPPSASDILAVVCAVMEVAPDAMPGKTTPRTKPRLQWARNMAAFVMHDLGLSDGAIAKAFGSVHRITIMVRRRRMAEKLETTQRYRDYHSAILARLAPSPAPAARCSVSRQPAAHRAPSISSSLSC
jgi:hypothetical protein